MACVTRVDGAIEYIHCDAAREFLDCLQIRNLMWLPDRLQQSSWIFRGQRRADWPLSPSALRAGNTWFNDFKTQNRDYISRLIGETEIEWKPGEFQPDADSLCDLVLQVAAEREVVAKFVELADYVGHPIPEDKRVGFGEHTIPNVVKDLLVFFRESPQPYYFVPGTIEFTLAQHHGIPTRLLDWTSIPFVAVLFAAEEAVRSDDPHNYDISVWAINQDQLVNSDLYLVIQRRAKISYLHAQGGICLCDTMANYHFIQYGEWRTFEQAVQQTQDEFSHPILRKITVSAKESYELLRLLAAENVTRAHLMPTYDNVTETLKMQRLLASRL